MTSISLALATYNQAGLLGRFLDNYFRCGVDLIPLIIVDDGSSDETPALLSAFPADAPIRVHTLEHVSAAHARNHALVHCPTPWIAFSDTDCLLDRQYFETLAGIPTRYPDVTALEGAVCPPSGPKLPFTHSLFNATGGTYATANMVFRVDPILKLGGFDEGFTVNFREDTDLALTIIDRVGPIPFCPDLVVIHPHIPRPFRKSLAKAYSVQDRVIRAEMRLFEKHPVSYSLVRHFRDARGTLFAWCWKYSGLYLKECWRYFFRTPGLTPGERAKGLLPACQAVTVAFFEQICIGAICFLKWNKIRRLRAP